MDETRAGGWAAATASGAGLVGGGPARGYASHGESWSLALALRLA
ncbi:hypothetical protein [Frankia sp. AgW1.1]|nr:hypothetical protein [Frankia sp. AgW1.1]